VHLHHSVTDPIVVAALDTTEKLDCHPLFSALHERGHDLPDAIFVKASGLNITDILLVVFASLLLARLLRDGSIPSIPIINTQSFNCRIRQRRCVRTISLYLTSDPPGTVMFTAVTGCRVATISVRIIVEHQLLPSFDVSRSKNAHAQLLTHNPFVDVAIGIARVIAKPTKITLLRSINNFARGEVHKIKMLETFIGILNCSPTPCWLINDLTQILVNEITIFEISIRAQAVVLLLSFDDRDIGP
jgi:hypothetical protein